MLFISYDVAAPALADAEDWVESRFWRSLSDIQMVYKQLGFSESTSGRVHHVPVVWIAMHVASARAVSKLVASPGQVEDV
jgi:hypothetical protein